MIDLEEYYKKILCPKCLNYNTDKCKEEFEDNKVDNTREYKGYIAKTCENYMNDMDNTFEKEYIGNKYSGKDFYKIFSEV